MQEGNKVGREWESRKWTEYRTDREGRYHGEWLEVMAEVYKCCT